ncbi:hypothetical protein EDE09_10619 [Neorhizobium sp. S3-V5DH]|nr:hypothetical protein EDE09_10619 [Neorhizobium sp. S3-V5DH]
MQKNVPNSVVTSDPIRLSETVALFEDMIRVLESGSYPKQTLGSLPGEPLTSLLQQCEKIAATPKTEAPALLVAFPGLPPLDLDWWRGHVPAMEFRRLSEPDGLYLSEAMVRTMQHDLAREGRELFLIATPFTLPSGFAFNPSRMRLLVCHPWRAYVAAGPALGLSLQDFCEVLSEHLQDLTTHNVLRYEDAANRQAVLIKILLGQESPPSPPAPTVVEPVDYFGGAPAYEQLCARLSYDPYRLIETDCLTYRAESTWLAAPQGGSAQISWFLPRVSMLLPDTSVRNVQALLPQIDSIVAAEAVPEALDALLSSLGGEQRALAMLLVAAHFIRKGEVLQALSLVTEALDETSSQAQGLTALASSLYLDMNRGALALDALTSGLRQSGLLAPPQIATLDEALAGRPAKKSTGDHGHALLMSRLRDRPPEPMSRKRLMIEIGTTREDVPGQGSTRKLAQLCAELGIEFITVDMDPSNSRRARRMFKRLGLPFKAITAKGEDFLASHTAPIDYVFLDAYDFDHGNHSEQRQERYERYLGNRISDAECHQMHLDCARSLVRTLAEDGLICFDDTWTDFEGNWSAKGTTAMPFLLENGFEVIEARNRAALLGRKR